MQRKPKGIFYRKSLIFILLSASIPGLIIGGSIYWIVVRQIENELLLVHQNQTYFRTENIDHQFTNLEMNLTHWAFEPRFGDRLIDLDFIHYFQETRDLNKTLLVMQGSNPLIKKVELYLHKTRPLLFKPDYTELTAGVYNELYARLLQRGKGIYWTNSEIGSESGRTGDASLVLVNKIPGGSAEPFGFLATFLDREKVAKLLKTLSPYNGGSTFIVNNRNEVLISASGRTKLTEFETALKDEVLSKNNRKNNLTNQGSFMFKWKGASYTVSYSKFPHLNSQWIYVTAAPISVITSPLVFSSKLMIVISFTGICLALCLSWFVSKKIYSPVERLLRLFSDEKTVEQRTSEHDEFKIFEVQWFKLTKQSKVLQSRLEEQLPQVKEGFLLQLLQGNLTSYTERDLLERMKYYGWTVDGKQFVVINIQLTGFSAQDNRFSAGDEGLVTFASANIIEELAATHLEQFHVINFHDLSVGLFVISSNQAKQQLFRLGEELTRAINRILRLRVTITVSKPARSLAQVPYMFKEVKKAIGYRIFEDQNQWIDLDDPDFTVVEDEVNYPFDLEKEIIQSLRMGNQEHTAHLIKRFLAQLSESGNKQFAVQQGMLQLLGSIQHEILHVGINPCQLYHGVNMYDQLSHIKEPQKMLKWMNEKVVQPCMQKFSERSNIHFLHAAYDPGPRFYTPPGTITVPPPCFAQQSIAA